MAAPAGSILPNSYFDGLSALWGGCAYLGSAIVAAGLVFGAAQNRNGAMPLVLLVTKVFFIGVATLFLREWLMRLNDVVIAFAAALGVDPLQVDQRFVTFISGKAANAADASVWDVIWGTKSIGTAVTYALLWLFGWLSWGIQYIVKLIGDILLTAGWALSPVFLSFFMVRPMAAVGFKYIIGLVALVCWPFGWVIAAVVTNAMIEAAATASLLPVLVAGSSIVAPGITVLLIGAWMLVSSILAPYVTTKVLLMGANPAAAFAQGVGGVAQAGVEGGVGAASTLATGGASGLAVSAAAALSVLSSTVESASRGGGSARMASAATAGARGFYDARYARRQRKAYEAAASAQERRAAATEKVAADFTEFTRQAATTMSGSRRSRSEQPHENNPNEAAIEIETHAKS